MNIEQVKKILQAKNPEMEITGESLLLLAVVESAVREGDAEYFEGEQFEKHMSLLGLDSDIIRRVALRLIDQEGGI